MSTVRILVVEDFAPFRRWLSSTLATKPELLVISEACDGVEAVRKAKELKPDVILLDVGLPKLNGIEAARQIQEISSDSKIIFVSQEFSPEVVQEALSAGAWGYVAKTRAATDLLIAIEAVISEKRFVSNF